MNKSDYINPFRVEWGILLRDLATFISAVSLVVAVNTAFQKLSLSSVSNSAKFSVCHVPVTNTWFSFLFQKIWLKASNAEYKGFTAVSLRSVSLTNCPGNSDQLSVQLHNCIGKSLSATLQLRPTVAFRQKLSLYICFSYFQVGVSHQQPSRRLIFSN